MDYEEFLPTNSPSFKGYRTENDELFGADVLYTDADYSMLTTYAINSYYYGKHYAMSDIPSNFVAFIDWNAEQGWAVWGQGPNLSYTNWMFDNDEKGIVQVMLIIMLLVGITLPVAKYVIRRAKEASRDANTEKIISALEDYRAAFGEYPIPGDPRHYAENYISDEEGYSPFTNVPLTSLDQYLVDTGDGDTVGIEPPHYGVEVLPFSDTYYNIDYSLTYPLMLGPLLRGEQPFILFSEVTVCYMVYKRKESSEDEKEHHVTRLLASGGTQTKSWWTLQGNPINRFLAIDPVSEDQLRLVCTNGLTYSIITNPATTDDWSE